MQVVEIIEKSKEIRKKNKKRPRWRRKYYDKKHECKNCWCVLIAAPKVIRKCQIRNDSLKQNALSFANEFQGKMAGWRTKV